jgi:DNA-binding transcriptional MerR regulator
MTEKTQAGRGLHPPEEGGSATDLSADAAEWSIRDLASASGLTSRALRHYEEVGVLAPSRVAVTGYRFYGAAEVARLYRILSLRSLDMPLPAIRAVLDDNDSLADAVRAHLHLLEEHRDLLITRTAAVRRALTAIEDGGAMTADELFGPVDPRTHESEVRERWGDDAWERSRRRRDGMTTADRIADQQRTAEVNAALREAAARDEDPAGEVFRSLAGEHYSWVTEQWGMTPTREAYVGLTGLYTADARFAAYYGGPHQAELVSAALRLWAEREL